MSAVLKDKVAIITGASQGIGRDFARRFAEEGARLVVAARSLDKLEKLVAEIKANGGEALAVKTDISDEASVKAMADAAIKQYGRVDILLNNAAVYYGLPFKPWDSWTVEEWDRLFEVNVRGTWLVCKTVAPHIIKQGKGKIINTCSNIMMPIPVAGDHLLHYTVSKGAIYTLTQCLARALGENNINVNAIAPGATASEATNEMLNDEAWAGSVAAQCIPRRAQTQDIVGIAVFLASDGSDMISGQVIAVDGGVWLK
ncbi:MAG: SDR family oxidoreductase [Chloroflexota bacterium]